MSFGLSETDLTIIREVLSSYSDVKIALIFGSRAKGTYKSASDIDIALKGTLKPDTTDEISAYLNNETPLPYFFDVLNYNTLTNPDLKKHIDRVGVVFYKNDKK